MLILADRAVVAYAMHPLNVLIDAHSFKLSGVCIVEGVYQVCGSCLVIVFCEKKDRSLSQNNKTLGIFVVLPCWFWEAPTQIASTNIYAVKVIWRDQYIQINIHNFRYEML